MLKNNKLDSKWILPGIVIIFLLISFPVITSGFFIWDDKEFLFSEIVTRSNWLDIFYKQHYGLYHPVTTAYVKLNFILHQNNPAILHTGNVLLHLINSLLVFQILQKLGFRGIVGFMVFLFHPLATEVVFWITSIKDLLFCLFSLLSIVEYLNYLKVRTKKLHFLLSLLFALLAMLSKIQAVFLPVILWLIDYYYNKRVFNLRTLSHFIFLIAGIGLVMLNLYFRRSDSDISTLPSFDFFTRLNVAAEVFTEYLVSAFLPVNLSVFYPFGIREPIPILSSAGLYLLVPVFYLTILIISFRKGYRELAFIMFLYAVSLSPVLQFFQIRESMRNDRYTYFSLFAIAFFLEHILKEENIRSIMVKNVFKVIAISFIILLMILFTFRASSWRQPKKILIESYHEFPRSEVLANTLGVIFLKENDHQSALKYLNRAIELAPDYAQAFYNRGLLFEKQEDGINAVSSYRQALSNNPNYIDAAFRLAQIWFMNNEINATRETLNRIDSRFLNAPSLDLMSKIEYMTGNIEESISFSKAAVKLDPSNEVYLYNYALSLGSRGNLTEVLKILNRCIVLNPSFPEAYYLRGITKIKLNTDGCADLQKAKALGNTMAGAAIEALCN